MVVNPKFKEIHNAESIIFSSSIFNHLDVAYVECALYMISTEISHLQSKKAANEVQGMKSMSSTHTSTNYLINVGIAVFVTLLWSSSWVIIKFGLRDELSPLIFAGLRYLLASLLLLMLVFSRSSYRKQVYALSGKNWIVIFMYGLIFIFITQGSQFIGLNLLPAITVTLLLNLTPVFVVFFSILVLTEIPSRVEWSLILLGMFGVLLYFYPIHIPTEELFGLLIVFIGVLANATAAIMGRAINQPKNISPVVITGLSMFFGSILLFITGLIFEGFVQLSLTSIIYIIWLSVINTALAFSLWNKTMQNLRAVDSSIINSLMLPQIVLLSLLFLDEIPSLLDWIGLGFLGFSVLLIQVIQAKRRTSLVLNSTRNL